MKYLALITLPFMLLSCSSPITSSPKSQTDSAATIKMNDTGQMQFSLCAPEHADLVYASNDANQVFSISSNDACPQQDAAMGRDFFFADDADGAGGFSFNKRDSSGKILTDQTLSYNEQNWACVEDKVTGLTWESKSNVASDINWSGHLYTWYNADNNVNGGDPGVVGNAASCSGLATCDTASYVAELNRIKFCGYSDWRVPLREELRSIIHYGLDDTGPMLDPNYFPNSSGIDHWTAETAFSKADASEAWEIHTKGGYDEPHDKGSSNVTVRLVRGPN